jgi:hypothetical protein
MTRFAFVFLLIISSVYSATAGTYLGNKMLEILGEDKNGEAFAQFKTEYLLDKTYKNAELGVKLTLSHDEVSTVSAITVTAAGYEMNEIKYKEFAGELPYHISLQDDGAALEQKFGAKSSVQDGKMKFKKDGITISVFFKASNNKKITYIKFTQNLGREGAPYRIDGDHTGPVMLASAAPDAIPAHGLSRLP